MDLDLTSFAYGFSIATSNGNPNWATSLGQGVGYKINASASINEILKGMIYTSVPMEEVQTRIGKGGKLYKGTDASSGIVLGSRFEKVYANGVLVPSCSLILILTRDNSKSHTGRLRLKYSPHNSIVNVDGDIVVSNEQEVPKIRAALGLSMNACWFVYALDVFEQDKLYLSIGVANSEDPVVYDTNADLHAAWQEIIQAAGGAIVPHENEKGIEEKPSAPPSPPDVSLLPLALRLFAERRVGEWRGAGREVNAKVRDYFAALTVETLAALDDGQIAELFCGVKGPDDKIAFKPMWSGGLGSAWSHIRPTSAAETQDVRDFLVRLRTSPGAAAEFRQDGFAHPKGFGPAVVSELLMKFHPESCFKHGHTTYEVLSWLGLVAFDHPFRNDFSDADYKQACGAAAKLLAAMREMKLPRAVAADDTGDGEEPDYLTVNEFVWFVNENKDLILQEWSKNMKHEIKLCPQTPVDADGFAAFIRRFADATEAAGLTYDDSLVKRFVCALLAKPFVVLTGLSGSGKTKLAQSFVQWISADGACKIVPVGADWTNSEKLLGYPNALDPNGYVLPDTGVLKLLIDANDNPSVPFFLVLDEMNLSHVERYFADFLSAMESEGEIRLYDGEKVRLAGDGTPVPPTLPFPKNLFVIGTMNVDETTHAFSPKVLDRAQVIEFRVNVDQINAFLDRPTRPDLARIAGRGSEYAAAFLGLHERPIALSAEDRAAMGEPLKRFFPVLAELGAEFAFRTAGEALAFCGFALKSPMGADEAVDAAIMQKLLPKLHGSRRRLAAPLEAFWGFCRKDGQEQTIADLCKKDAKETVADVAKFPVSAEKIRRLYKSAEQNGFASYAEA